MINTLSKIKLLNINDYNQFEKIFQDNIHEKKQFEIIGWSNNQIKKQLKNKNNFSLGMFLNDILIAFIVGNIIIIEKYSEYEILLLYVDKNFRKKGNASLLISSVIKHDYLYPLKKITLEVSKSNMVAINFYKKK